MFVRICTAFFLTGAAASALEASGYDAICQELSEELVSKISENTDRDYRLYRVENFYSAKLDACIHVEAKMFGPDVQVRDLTRSVIRDTGYFYPPMLLHCDADGVDEADIGAVRARAGLVWDVPYEQWLTDGQGGPARAMSSPNEPYTREDCEAALDRWLARWK